MTTNINIIKGDARNLAMIPDATVACAVTSPPYPKQRKYGDDPREIGGGGTVEEFCNEMVQVAAQVRRKLIPGGTYWLNLGEKCLAGPTVVYCRTSKGVNSSELGRLHDTYGDEPTDLQLWTGDNWSPVTRLAKTKNRHDVLRLTLRSGEQLVCSRNHVWPLANGEMRHASMLNQYDVLAFRPLPDNPASRDFLPDEDIGWLVGLYLAEGHIQDSAVIFSGHEDEDRRHKRLEWIADAFDAPFGLRRQRPTSKGVSAAIHSPIVVEVIRRYVGGDRATSKRLRHTCWKRGNVFLRALLLGYLEGDGGLRADRPDQWQLGFTDNGRLVSDLRTVGARVGWSVRLRRGATAGFGKRWNTYRGDTMPVGLRKKPDSQIVKIEPAPTCTLYDVTIADEPHLFALASGVMTHNSNGSGGAGGDYNRAGRLDGKPKYGRFTDPDYALTQHLGISRKVEQALQDDGWRVRLSIIWDKGGRGEVGSMAHARRPMLTHEYILMLAPDKVTTRFNERAVGLGQFVEGYESMHERCFDQVEPGSVWHFAPGGDNPEAKHLAPFPIELPRRCILLSTRPNELVLDPFAGSGTTGRAAEMLGRRFVGVDLYAGDA